MVLTLLGISAFEKKDGKFMLTEEQRAALVAELGEDWTKQFVAQLANYTEETQASDVIAASLAQAQADLKIAQADLATANADKTALETDKQELVAKVARLDQKVNILSEMPIIEKGASKKAAVTPETQEDILNDKYLYGVIAPHMAIDDKHPYNKRAYAALVGRLTGQDMPTPKQTTLDYDSLKSDLGDFYRIRKQEKIQSFLLKLPSIESLFPSESGYQDRAVLVNMFLEEFSQADNTSSSFDNVIKGGYKFEPEELRMYDVMFAYKFTDLKKLEKTWIGYLNREGSDTMKWSFIEFIMVETGKKLHNERELRRIHGRRINPTLNVPGTAMGASNGLRQFVQSKIDSFQIRPFVMGEWTPTTISEYVRLGTSYIPSVVRDSGRLKLYMSTDALTAYHKNNELLYGLNQDYKPDLMTVKEYPSVSIKPIPNMAESKRMIWTIEGNISLFEDEPGEMYKFYFEQQDWSLKVWSNWKESIWAYLVGKKYASLAEIPTDYSTQMIFCNDVDFPADYYLPMTADDVTPSVSVHTSLISVANAAATAITNIDNAVVGQEVRLKCGNATNAITIAAAGNFSLLTAAWTPAVGDILVLRKRSDGKFIEISRITATTNISRFVADDATPSVTGGDTFMVASSAADLAITNLDDAIVDKVYTIHGFTHANDTTIANAGNFVLTAAFAATDGKWIKLVKSSTDSKFYEISRG